MLQRTGASLFSNRRHKGVDMDMNGGEVIRNLRINEGKYLVRMYCVELEKN